MTNDEAVHVLLDDACAFPDWIAASHACSQVARMSPRQRNQVAQKLHVDSDDVEFVAMEAGCVRDAFEELLSRGLPATIDSFGELVDEYIIIEEEGRHPRRDTPYRGALCVLLNVNGGAECFSRVLARHHAPHLRVVPG